MRGSTSPPTARVLDIIELLARPGNERMRFSDVVRELALTQATTHTILKTLCDRGWVNRDIDTKTFSLGPALSLVAARADAVRPLTHAARVVARQLADEIGCAASVIEHIDDDLVLTAFEGDHDQHTSSAPGDRIPFRPPFGVAFAAWAPADEQRAWIERGAATDSGLSQRLAEVLARTRARGFEVDWTTPALTQSARLVGALPNDGLPANIRQIVEQLLVEFTTIGMAAEDQATGAQPVTTIAAPVFDTNGRVALIVALHPFDSLTLSQTIAIGRKAVRGAATVT